MPATAAHAASPHSRALSGGCSAAVAALASLLAPFPPPDFRPYFTIHDPAFAGLASGMRPDGANGLPSLIGATNTYFLQALADFPNVLSSGYSPATALAAWGSADLRASVARSSNSGSSSSGSGASSRLAGLLGRRPARPLDALRGGSGVDAAWLSYRPLCRPDSAVLGSLVQPVPGDPPDRLRRIAQVNTAILHKHFQDLGKALLFAVLPHITPCPPLRVTHADSGAPTPCPLPLPPLVPEQLLARLSDRNARLPEVGRCVRVCWSMVWEAGARPEQPTPLRPALPPLRSLPLPPDLDPAPALWRPAQPGDFLRAPAGLAPFPGLPTPAARCGASLAGGCMGCSISGAGDGQGRSGSRGGSRAATGGADVGWAAAGCGGKFWLR